jgi:hypothetical protein
MNKFEGIMIVGGPIPSAKTFRFEMLDGIYPFK